MYYSFFKLFSLSLPHFLGSLLVHFNVASPTFAGTLCFGLFVFFSCQTNIDCLLFPLLFRVGLFALGAFLGFWVASFALSLPVRPLLPPPSPNYCVYSPVCQYLHASQPACLPVRLSCSTGGDRREKADTHAGALPAVAVLRHCGRHLSSIRCPAHPCVSPEEICGCKALVRLCDISDPAELF